MFINALPPGALEILLFVVLLGAFIFVVVRVARRNSLPTDLQAADLASLPTALVAEIEVRRLFRDRAIDAVLAEGQFPGQRLTFCITDFASNSEHYRKSLGSRLMISAYALATLESAATTAFAQALYLPATAGATTLELIYSGPRPNDYTIRGIIAAVRLDQVDGESVAVYRFSRADGLTLEAAVEATPDTAPFDEGNAIIGTVRLYGYLTGENRRKSGRRRLDQGRAQ